MSNYNGEYERKLHTVIKTAKVLAIAKVNFYIMLNPTLALRQKWRNKPKILERLFKYMAYSQQLLL